MPIRIAKFLVINVDTLTIEQGNTQDGEHSGALKGECGLPFADTVHRFDAFNRDRGTSEPFKPEHHIRSEPDTSLGLFDQII